MALSLRSGALLFLRRYGNSMGGRLAQHAPHAARVCTGSDLHAIRSVGEVECNEGWIATVFGYCEGIQRAAGKEKVVRDLECLLALLAADLKVQLYILCSLTSAS